MNKRGTRKRSRLEGGASWTSHYGSVTFNQFGRDNPTTGINNEKGLMISLMWLDGTEYPPPTGGSSASEPTAGRARTRPAVG